MRFALIQIALGVVLLAGAITLGPWARVLLWPGGSVLAVGVAYLRIGGFGPGVFGKRLDGRLRWPNVALLLPYFVVAWTLWQLKSRIADENPYDEVAPGILVGRRPLTPDEFPSHATVVVDLTSEFSRSPATTSVARYECAPTLDTTPPDDDALVGLVDALADHDGVLFVHCAMGHGRSATVAAGLLLRRGLAVDVQEAIALMKAQRPLIHLHRGQRDAITRLFVEPGRG